LVERQFLRPLDVKSVLQFRGQIQMVLIGDRVDRSYLFGGRPTRQLPVNRMPGVGTSPTPGRPK
jgi:hypothetical protein